MRPRYLKDGYNTLEDVLEVAYHNQCVIDEWKRVTGLKQAPWVVVSFKDWWPF